MTPTSLPITTVDIQSCAAQVPRPAPPVRWEERMTHFWAGVYAWQSGDITAAKARYEQAFDDVMAVGDPLKLPHIALGIAVADAGRDPSILVGRLQEVAALLKRVTPEDSEVRADALAELGVIALEHLHSPAAAYFPTLAALQLMPKHLGAGITMLQVQLAIGQYAEALRTGPSIVTPQTDKSSRLTVAALLWAATRLGSLRGSAASLWSMRLQREFQGLFEGKQPTTHFDGLRFALIKSRPSDPAALHVLAILDFLDRPKLPSSEPELTKLLTNKKKIPR
jgi:hypothetical protein